MHNLDLLLTLAGGLSAALILGYITHRAGLSPIVGYLIAGTVVGPYTPGFVANSQLAEQMAEVGVILLMFGVGLQFHLDELLAVRRIAIPGAIAQSGVATILGALLGRALGWSWAGAIIFGIALSVASTVVLVRVLADNRALHTQTGHIAVGWLVIEDLFTVIALVLLPAVFGGGGAVSATGLATAMAITAFKVAALVGFTVIVGNRLIPYLLDRVGETRSRELFTLTVLVLALGIAVGSALVFDVSMALGAFLAGMVVGRSDYSLRAASEALPMRDAFAVLFFVSVGMLLDPQSLMQSPMLLAATLGIVLIGKPLVAFVLVWAMRYPLATALSVSVALAQIGEFSFILSTVGKDLGVMTADASNTLVAVAIVSIVLNPLLYRAIGPVERWVKSSALAGKDLATVPNVAADGHPADSRHRAIVVGYGPTGRTVARLMKSNGVEPTFIELNMDTVRGLREQQVRGVYGDASNRNTLEQAGMRTADTLILTSAGMSQTEDVIRLARELNPSVHVLARTAYLRDVDALKRAGANQVFAGESEIALAFTESILTRLGATADQIDRERKRVHEDLFGAP